MHKYAPAGALVLFLAAIPASIAATYSYIASSMAPRSSVPFSSSLPLCSAPLPTPAKSHVAYKGRCEKDRVAKSSVHRTAPVTLTSVSPQNLEENGIQLAAPATTSAITQDSAEKAALTFAASGIIPRAHVLESVFAQINSTTQRAITGQSVWVVSLYPAGDLVDNGFGKQIRVSYALVFIDPRTGKTLGSFIAGG